MNNRIPRVLGSTMLVSLVSIGAAGCATSEEQPEVAMSEQPTHTSAPPPAIQAWMDRLTVDHEYDPETGFIVARETISLPPLIADGPSLDDAIQEAGDRRVVIAFVTADRCAPCQQYKRDTLNDDAVIARLSHSRFLPTHVEVDRSPELAEAHLGSRAIPMTYALRDGQVVSQLRGQRSASDLLEWLAALPE